MSDLIGGLFGLLLMAAAIGLFIAANVWRVFAIIAVILVLLIIYGMATCDNEWVSGLTLMAICIPALYVLYHIAN